MDAASLTAASVTNTTLAFITFMPSPATIAQGNADTGMRVNEVSAVCVSIGLGVALSVIAKSGEPLAAALVASLAMVLGYEYLARTTDVRITAATNRKDPNVRI